MKGFLVLTLFIFVSGCAMNKPMPEEKYQQFGSYWTALNQCSQSKYIDVKLTASAREAFSYMLTTWEFDVEKLKRSAKSFEGKYVNAGVCREIEVVSHQLISAVGNRKEQVRSNNIANQEAWNNAVKQMNQNKPIFCNQFGTMVMCN